ncbi:hypothetical protein ACYRFS_12190 [Listeria kieliensis]
MFMEENKNKQLRIIDKLLDTELSHEEASILRHELKKKERERTEARGLAYEHGETKGRNEVIDLTEAEYFSFKKEGKTDGQIAELLGFSKSTVSKRKIRKGLAKRKKV